MFNYTRNDQILKKTPITPLPITPPTGAQQNVFIPPMEQPEIQPMPISQQPMEQPEIQPISITQQPMVTPQPMPMGQQPMPISQQPIMNIEVPSMPGSISHNITCVCPNVPMCPHMVQGAPAESIKAHDDMELAYLKKMYPPVCQKIQYYIENELNKYDHELSPIYEMYPAQESIDHMANCIYSDMKDDMADIIAEYEGIKGARVPVGGAFYTLAYALLLNELYRRRMRRRIYPTPYYSPFSSFY